MARLWRSKADGGGAALTRGAERMDLTVKILGDNSRLRATIAQTQRMVIGFGTALKAVLAGSAIQGALQLIASPFTKFKEALDLGGEVADLKQQTGQTRTALLQMRNHFRDSGVGIERLRPSINLLQKALAGMNEDGEPTAKIFGQLGLEVNKLRGMAAPEQFAAIGEALQKIKNPADRTAAAMKLFGKSGGEMLGALNDPAGFTKPLTAAQALLAKNAELMDEVGDAMGRIAENGKGLFIGLAAGLAPALKPLLEAMEQIDFSAIGQRLGNAMAVGLEIFRSGQATEVVVLALKIAAQEFANFYVRIWRGLGAVIASLLANVFRGAVETLAAVTKPEFWQGVGNALAGGALKLEAGVRAASAYLQAAGAWFAAKMAASPGSLQQGLMGVLSFFNTWWVKALINPVGFLAERLAKLAMGFGDTLRQALKGSFSDAAKTAAGLAALANPATLIAKIAGQFSQGMAGQAAGGSAGADFQTLLREKMISSGAAGMNAKADGILGQNGANLSGLLAPGMNRMRDAFGGVGAAFQSGFGGEGIFDSSGDREKLGGIFGDIQARLAAATPGDEKAAEFGSASKSALASATGEKKPGSSGGVITSSLARIGGGGFAAGGTAGIWRSMDSHLKKIVTNTAAKPMYSGPLQMSGKGGSGLSISSPA